MCVLKDTHTSLQESCGHRLKAMDSTSLQDVVVLCIAMNTTVNDRRALLCCAYSTLYTQRCDNPIVITLFIFADAQVFRTFQVANPEYHRSHQDPLGGEYRQPVPSPRWVITVGRESMLYARRIFNNRGSRLRALWSLFLKGFSWGFLCVCYPFVRYPVSRWRAMLGDQTLMGIVTVYKVLYQGEATLGHCFLITMDCINKVVIILYILMQKVD